jgi:hypothetical protein
MLLHLLYFTEYTAYVMLRKWDVSWLRLRKLKRDEDEDYGVIQGTRKDFWNG